MGHSVCKLARTGDALFAGVATDHVLFRPPDRLARLLANASDPTFRHPAEAVELARQVVEREPKNGAYWTTLGIARVLNEEQARAAIEAAQP